MPAYPDEEVSGERVVQERHDEQRHLLRRLGRCAGPPLLGPGQSLGLLLLLLADLTQLSPHRQSQHIPRQQPDTVPWFERSPDMEPADLRTSGAPLLAS